MVLLLVATVGLTPMAFLEFMNMSQTTRDIESQKIGLFRLKIMLRKKVGVIDWLSFNFDHEVLKVCFTLKTRAVMGSFT